MAQGNAAGALAGAGKFTELRQRLLFVLGALIVYRIGCFIPVPGVNPDAMLAMMQAQGGGIVDMFNMFSGGALHRFSIFALNVMPYISASIVMQLGVHIFPSLKALQKEGESGRRKITQYSRIGAVLLAVVQGGSIATALQNQVAPGGMPVVYAPGMGFVLTAVVALTAGTIFLMWLGEQVTERGIGNGVSLIIFAGIVAGLPGAVIQTVGAFRDGTLSFISLLVIAVVVLGFTFLVVFVERGQRRITVNYARRQGGRNAYMTQTSFLPLKLNMAGVIPPIFASSILAFPATLAMWSGENSGATTWLQRISNALVAMAMAQNTKNARVYTPCRDSASGCPNQCRSWGSTMAKTSISSTPAIKKAGHAIHIRRCVHISVLSPGAAGVARVRDPGVFNVVGPARGWPRGCGP